MTLTIFTHPDCEAHELPGHAERPERLRSVMARLKSSGITGEADLKLAIEVSDADLLLTHPRSHIDLITGSEPTSGKVRIDADTWMNTGSLRACRLAAGACTSAVRGIVNGNFQSAFCAVRPPGHHAELAVAMGFCLFNNIAIAADVALQHPEINRVAIVDFDVHHCNGTVDIFKDRPEVLVCSSFQDDFYPYRYLDFTNDHIISTPLAAGSAGSAFRQAVESVWLPALHAHQPDMLLISAGFDAHANDPLGGLRFQEEDYEWITRQLIDVARQHCGGKILSTLEGGYDLSALASSVEVHAGTLLQHS
jgi:acetoin utilization deacetylase AcuC-like enzyme